jgi:hypothetical protein
MRHRELHRIAHAGWLRAAVLGANDGLISTSSRTRISLQTSGICVQGRE